MGTFAYAIRAATEYVLLPFDYLPDWLGLTLLSLLTGVVALWVVGKCTVLVERVVGNKGMLERTRDRMASAVYELRLYLDSPKRMFIAQGRLIAWGVAYTGLLLPPVVVLIIPLGTLFFQMDLRYGQEALPVGETLVVEARVADDVDGDAVEVADAAGLEVTAPPLYVADEQRLYVRLRVKEPGVHTLTLNTPAGAVSKEISADPSAARVSPQRGTGADMMAELFYTAEPALDGEPIVRIDVPHPASDATYLAMTWWLFWLVVSTAAALALRKPMGVVL